MYSKFEKREFEKYLGKKFNNIGKSRVFIKSDTLYFHCGAFGNLYLYIKCNINNII
jgi:hypothetical protein